MQHIQTSPQAEIAAPLITISTQDGAQIAALGRTESVDMATEELRRFIAFLETLHDNDWSRPTGCTMWSVKDIVAHQCAHVVGLTGFTQFAGQLSPIAQFPYLKKGMSPLDAWNQSEVDKRRSATPADLIAELRGASGRSLRGRTRIPRFILAPKLPLPGFDKPRSLGYLFETTYTRDMWMHRLDIHNAVGRTMSMDAAHDKRIVALCVLDLAEKCARDLNGRSMVLILSGVAGGTYRLGANSTPSATVEMDVPTFASVTSGREQAEQILDRVAMRGDTAFAREFVNYLYNRVLY